MAFEISVPVLDSFGGGRPAAKDTVAGIVSQEAAYEVSFPEKYWLVFLRGGRQIGGIVVDPNNRILIHFHLSLIIRFMNRHLPVCRY